MRIADICENNLQNKIEAVRLEEIGKG
jgi:hypothetical protein